MLTVSNPEIHIPVIFDFTNVFSRLSGSKINFSDKSETMPLGGFDDVTALSNFPFKSSTSGFLYLGLSVTLNIKDLLKINFLPLIRTVKIDLKR